MRSSHFGSHQAALPSRCITAGMMSNRTTNASSSTPTASPKPIDWIITEFEKMNPEKTEAMMSAAAMTTVRPA